MKANSQQTGEDILCGEKQAVARKFLWGAFSVIGIFILLAAIAIIVASNCRTLKKTEAEKIAVNALRLKLDNPSTLKVLDISNPDSVFTNRMCPEYEVMELSERFLEYSMNIMRESQTNFQEDYNATYRCRMERYTESSNALNTLNSMLEKSQGKHCGWRIKVKYQAVDDSDTPYTSEVWFILDKERKHILNSFDISLL